MKYIILLFSPLILLTACFDDKVTPNQLPTACLGQYYSQKIEILNGYVIDLSFHYKVSDKNFHISPRRYNKGKQDVDIYNIPLIHEDYNELKLTGIPNSLEPIKVHINYSIYKHMFSFFEPRNGYEKTYIIKVEDCGQNQL